MKLRERYKLNKTTKVGDECVCPSCGTKFIKTNYQQAFCKSKGGTICKDKYWNTITPEKRCNTTRISPATRTGLGLSQRPRPCFAAQHRVSLIGQQCVGGTGAPKPRRSAQV